jgi:hypothetical protein
MKTKKFRLHYEDKEHDSYFLGAVQTPDDDEMTKEDIQHLISDAWDEFQSEEPDSDSEFVAFLVENHGFIELKDEFDDYIVNQ